MVMITFNGSNTFMRKSIILAAAVAVLAMLASCQKEEFVGEPAGTGEGLVFTATIDNPATRTTVNTDGGSADRGKVNWGLNDEITISDGTNTAVYEMMSLDMKGNNARFTMKSGDDLAESGVTYTATYGSAPLAVQTYSDEVVDLPMRATSTTTALHFRVTCGLLKLNLTKAGESVKSIAVTGTPTGDTETTYTLTCPTAQSIASGKDFFITLPAGTYTKFVITDSNDKFCTINASKGGLTIEANKIQPLSFSSSLTFDCIWFPDANLRSLMLNGDKNSNVHDTNGDGAISLSEAQAITSFSCSGGSITDLTGLEYCVNITNLNVSNNTGITSADLTTLTKLTNLDIGNTGITTLDLSQNTELAGLSLIQCSGLTTIDLSKNTKLQSLSAQSSGLTELSLLYNYPALASLEVGGCNSLETLRLYQCTGLTSLNLVNDLALKDLFVPYCTNLTSMDVSNCSALANVILWDCTALTTLTGMKKTARMYVHHGLKPSIYQVGQLIRGDEGKNFNGNDAVVYEVGGDYARAVSVDENYDNYKTTLLGDGCPDSDRNGYGNTKVFSTKNHSAAVWCTGHGDWWYWPASVELHNLMSVKAEVNATLSAVGSTQIQGSQYLSSTYEDSYQHDIAGYPHLELVDTNGDVISGSGVYTYLRAAYLLSNSTYEGL